MFASISHVVLLSSEFNPGLFVFFGDFQNFSINFITGLELIEFFSVGAFYSVETTDKRLVTLLSDLNVKTVTLNALKRSRNHETFF